ncbi:MAG: sterol desaturase family protein [Alphaproteobacteria bacterium]|nr:sterol desaturase family protein [Alphaproteobacteria bacterium]
MDIAGLIESTVFFLVVLALIAVPLENLAPLVRRRARRAGLACDAVHLLLTKRIGDVLAVPLIALAGAVLRPLAVPQEMQAAVAGQPVALQVLEALLIADLCGYWVHRLSHEIGPLWRLHAVHHASENLDWLATARQHPLDAALRKCVKAVPAFLIGFSYTAIAWFAAASLALSLVAFLVHANVRMRLGFLEWVHISPRFHHWHHALAPVNRNYAEQFPLWDALFGTLHLPVDGSWPPAYGTSQPVPDGWLRQMLHPFARTARPTGEARERPG